MAGETVTLWGILAAVGIGIAIGLIVCAINRSRRRS